VLQMSPKIVVLFRWRHGDGSIWPMCGWGARSSNRFLGPVTLYFFLGSSSCHSPVVSSTEMQAMCS
jgi:hypothetical protein